MFLIIKLCRLGSLFISFLRYIFICSLANCVLLMICSLMKNVSWTGKVSRSSYLANFTVVHKYWLCSWHFEIGTVIMVWNCDPSNIQLNCTFFSLQEPINNLLTAWWWYTPGWAVYNSTMPFRNSTTESGFEQLMCSLRMVEQTEKGTAINNIMNY